MSHIVEEENNFFFKTLVHVLLPNLKQRIISQGYSGVIDYLNKTNAFNDYLQLNNNNTYSGNLAFDYVQDLCYLYNFSNKLESSFFNLIWLTKIIFLILFLQANTIWFILFINSFLMFWTKQIIKMKVSFILML